mmetsp:Transcript_49164/g.141314  ORF Transcript_49164/g.141314 Transcript_49164/m.141314 type:complete len:211 (-) Transcript_49164:650-1282(-)
MEHSDFAASELVEGATSRSTSSKPGARYWCWPISPLTPSFPNAAADVLREMRPPVWDSLSSTISHRISSWTTSSKVTTPAAATPGGDKENDSLNFTSRLYTAAMRVLPVRKKSSRSKIGVSSQMWTKGANCKEPAVVLPSMRHWTRFFTKIAPWMTPGDPATQTGMREQPTTPIQSKVAVSSTASADKLCTACQCVMHIPHRLDAMDSAP